MDNGDIEDYRTVINETLQVLYMRANEDGKRFKSDNYIGMELENLQTNIEQLREAITKLIYGVDDRITNLQAKLKGDDK